MPFQFRLHSILKLRQLDRDQQQQVVLSARMNLSRCQADCDRIADERSAILDELREMNRGEPWALDQVRERKSHAEYLGQAISVAESSVIEAKNQLEHHLALLTKADQFVKMLERLAERQNEDYQDSQQKQIALNGFPV